MAGMFVSIGQFLQVPNEVLQRLSGKEFKTVLQGLGQGKSLQELAGEVQDAHHFAFKSQVNPQQVQKSLQSRLKRIYLQIVFRLKQFQSRYKTAKAEVNELKAELAARKARTSASASKPGVRPLSPVKPETSAKELAERDAIRTDKEAIRLMQDRQNSVGKHGHDWNSHSASGDSSHSPWHSADDALDHHIPQHFDGGLDDGLNGIGHH
jgi:hypothetical protein